jgi:phosphate starvation-inducible membrane PsiE
MMMTFLFFELIVSLIGAFMSRMHLFGIKLLILRAGIGRIITWLTFDHLRGITLVQAPS